MGGSVGGASLPAPRLRPVEPGDHPFLYQLACRWPETWPRLCLKGTPAPPEFDALLWRSVLLQYLVEVRIEQVDVPVGLVALFDVDQVSGTGWVDRVGLPGEHHEQVLDAGFADLITRAFSSWPLRLVHGAHHGMVAPLFSGLPVEGTVEVVLPACYRHDGFAWDRVISTILREDWPDGGPP